MRVCAVAYSTYPFDPRVRREARELVRQGHEVDIIALRGPREKREEVVDGVRVTRMPLEARRGGRLRYLYQYLTFSLLSLAQLVRDFPSRRYHVMHIHSLPDFLVFVAVPFRVIGVRIVLDLHESMPEILAARFGVTETSKSYRLAAFLESISCGAADFVIAVNETIRKLLEARDVSAAKIRVVTNAADPDVFSLEPPPWHPSGEIIIVGGVNVERDFDTVLEAIARMEVDVRYRLTIVGHGPAEYQAHLLEKTRELGLDRWVDLRDPVSHADVPALLARSEIGLVSYVDNPLTRVATPNKAYELAAMGRPLVLPRLPALESTFGATAVYYAPGDSAQLAQLLSDLRTHPERLQQLAAASQAVSMTFSWTRMADRLATIYQELRHG